MKTPLYGLFLPLKAQAFLLPDPGGLDAVIARDGRRWLFRSHETTPYLLVGKGAGHPEDDHDACVLVRTEDGAGEPMPDLTRENCGHALRWEGARDGLECKLCAFSLPGQALKAMGFGRRDRYCRDGNDLADESQRLRDENSALLAENARLRRRLERGQR